MTRWGSLSAKCGRTLLLHLLSCFYGKWVEDVCAGRTSRLLLFSGAGCEFGDKSTDCRHRRLSNCSRADVNSTCCLLCVDYVPTTTTTTTTTTTRPTTTTSTPSTSSATTTATSTTTTFPTTKLTSPTTTLTTTTPTGNWQLII